MFVGRIGQMFSIKTHTSQQLLNKMSVTAQAISKWVFLIRFSVGLIEKGIRGALGEPGQREQRPQCLPCEKEFCDIVKGLDTNKLLETGSEVLYSWGRSHF